ncbi:hypothetical protein BCR44DRAFT_49531 [Catenaria anguillulae PL171]|uniref:Chitin-binding type-4 domain-containing protein n=1 Tax=Catenaria anguillulae PL171 TaxID=765915 RepID=A0A1Y2HTS3_9FUNG|nr:hypothetical protein BCR44DRAFT_49531 [Catenaria anguillulae PL171]
MTSFNLVSLLALVALVATSVNAHMMMSDPAPRQSKGNPGPGGQIDFDYPSPLGTFPCKGYPAQAPVKTVAAGSSLPITLSGGAPHDGGHCQFALSYDGDKTFVVINTIIRECMRRSNPFQTTITIPATAPSGKATLAWTWINAVGNREYYMSCADIQITGGSGPSGSLSGPELLVAHLPGFNQFSFPEFGGNSPDRRELFDQRRTITVRGNGQSSGGGGSGNRPQPPAPQPQPPTRPQPPQQPPTRPQPPQQPSPRPQPPTRPQPPAKDQLDGGDAGAACTAGQLKCTKGGQAYMVCNFGKFLEMPLAAGTKCEAGANAGEIKIAAAR